MHVLGVHPIAASEPVHLIVLDLGPGAASVDWSSITQPDPAKDQSYWQVPYDEMPLPGSEGVWTFFFHFLDLSRPLVSNLGNAALVPETPLPQHLKFRKYEAP